MIKNISEYLALLYCVLLLTQTCTSETHEVKPVKSVCIPRERDALLAVKAGLLDPKNRLSSWKGSDCCQWMGVTCSNTTEHIVRLDLRNTYIQYDDDEIGMSYALGGEIRSPITSLLHLQYLDLSYNYFSGTKIPEFIGSLIELTYLNLTSAGFGGRIPPQIANLSKLQYLDLSNKGRQTFNLTFPGFVGKIPPQISNLSNLQYLDLSGWPNHLYADDVTWLMHYSSLKHLDLGSVNLSSVIKWEGLNTLPHLKTLSLNECRLDTNFTLSHVNFTELVSLDLGYNKFSNPSSLTWILNLTNLNYVDLSASGLDSRIMNILGKINSIETLYLHGNNLMYMKGSDLGNLTNLRDLALFDTQITGDITEFMESLPLHGLQSLDLSGNNLNGNLSGWIGHMTSLSTLWLSSNNLSGPIPLSIRKLTQLVYLDLSNNNFYGTITEKHLSKMTSLEYLSLTGNPLNIIADPNWTPPFRLNKAELSSCNLGPKFPQWLKSQTNITFLDISNTSIADEVPVWFWHVFSNASYLYLSQNNLSGYMPENLEFMSVTTLHLNDNKFQGSIPKFPKTLYELDLSRNALSGSLQLSTKYLSLTSLYLSGNLLTGSIPQSLCLLSQLEFLDLSFNFFIGNFPNCGENNLDAIKMNYSNEGYKNRSFVRPIVLKVLTLSYNNLFGKFPEYLKYCTNLVFLNLENNNFFGTIPSWIGEKLPSLGFLLLGSNKLSGTIPNQLFELNQLQVLDLSHNNLKGTIPRSLKTLKAMTNTNDLDFSDLLFAIQVSPNVYTVTITAITKVDTKGEILNFEGNIGHFKSFDLSGNNLAGYIPEEIGSLVGLRNLNLSRNKFSGYIPSSIGHLQLLESLDLSNNKLYGSIPSSLSNLTFVSYLNLSCNNLFGRIPSGRQLQTFDDPSIYEGNSGLCGFPLKTECFGNRTTPQPLVLETKDGYDFYVGVLFGFTLGFLIVYGALLLFQSLRVEYFVFVDNTYDWLYVFIILNWTKIAQNREKNLLEGDTELQAREENC